VSLDQPGTLKNPEMMEDARLKASQYLLEFDE
jgi:hypothetical protein